DAPRNRRCRRCGPALPAGKASRRSPRLGRQFGLAETLGLSGAILSVLALYTHDDRGGVICHCLWRRLSFPPHRQKPWSTSRTTVARKQEPPGKPQAAL